MHLMQSDFGTGTWDRLRADMEARLLSLRKRNDADLPPEETAGVRGQIRELNYWLSLQPHSPPAEMPSGIFD